MIAVITGNYKEYLDYLRLEVPKGDHGKYRYAGAVADIRGIRFAEIVKWGTWYEHHDLAMIELLLATRLHPETGV